jgi:hypothetical protein
LQRHRAEGVGSGRRASQFPARAHPN